MTIAKETALLPRLMGADWHLLHPDVQQRFAHDPEPGHPKIYQGVMDIVACNTAGRLFAFLTRLIGNPLTSHTGQAVPAVVTLTAQAKGGVAWHRLYRFDGKAPCRVTSIKRADARGRLCEYVGFGFGMRLAVSVQDGALHFISEHYVWEIGGWQIPLPHLLTPGRTHVVHEPLNGGRFRFSLSMDHPWLGRTFYQTGIFEAVP
ncbi:DUF4166 domain-containing protein [Asticcacaulis sp. BYS171W]|uniref:DUF4166 domain-containing protein n=1 Tax=Asticcacaulis aquaticus TaxID=2984212 RepID=A0ABT5HY52_9CAUL|nr:DUF4166 domain-containing protein [Asticcacaulis aquaticus]MDC7684979.1 DUF4166 domain-containing protein [Asticcacaulis aquaticus]